MAFSGGVFTLVAGNPVVTGTVISSTTMNNTLSDIATGLSTCILKDGSQTVTANIPMGSNKFTGLAQGTSNGDSLRYEQVFSSGGTTISASTGTFTITLTGFTTTVTGTASYSITNNIVTLTIPAMTGTSNATTMTATGLPAAIQPTTAKDGFPFLVSDNGANPATPAKGGISAGTITFAKDYAGGAWTNSGTKGIPTAASMTYSLA